ncbi:hypothetical protein A0H81_09479 [Grifola frondosa]|uniref:Uncharacterized protein n=1 Tax=Grifola frondosa TaxID=5627 RepID=A0A1C7M1P3_GRIFR|nr:hypothetical protein A0H81_09479 [Grifola frondosa]
MKWRRRITGVILHNYHPTQLFSYRNSLDTQQSMRFSALPVLLAGAGLATIQQIAASPIRVVVTEVSSNVRYGHAAADANSGPVAHIAHIAAATPSTPSVHHGSGRHFCSVMRSKALEMSNSFREMLGLPPIEASTHGAVPTDWVAAKAVPALPFIGTPVEIHENGKFGVVHEPGFVHILPVDPFNRPDRPNRPMSHRFHRGSFVRRIHHALMALGPWEGRAVAFVLGCGIGVFAAHDMEEEFEEVVVFDEVEALPPPPQYTDEKVAAVAEKSVDVSA